MIIALIKRKNDNIISFDIEGHAGYAESGSDIVCSAVSALTYTTINGIIEVLKINLLPDIDFKINEETGFASLNITNRDIDDIENCQVLLKTLLIGLESMEEYKDYIKVRIEEV